MWGHYVTCLYVMTVFPQSWPCHVMSLCHVSLCHECIPSVMTVSHYVPMSCVSTSWLYYSAMTLSRYVPMSGYVRWHSVSCYVMRYVLGPISHLGHEPIIPIPLLRVPRPIPWVWPPLPLLHMYIAPDLVLNGTHGLWDPFLVGLSDGPPGIPNALAHSAKSLSI